MTRVAVLGTGILGSSIAVRLHDVGLSVVVWNRHSDRTAILQQSNIHVAAAAVDAVRGADIVLTTLFDGPAVLEVMASAAAGMGPSTVWIQASTVGLDAADAIAAFARHRGLRLIDAPVLGTKDHAETGTLVVMASGPTALRNLAAPAFDAMASRVVWVGLEPGDGSKLKLVVNAWVATIVSGAAQSIAFAQGLGIDPALFLEVVLGHNVDSPYLQIKGRAMIDGHFPPASKLKNTLKDVEAIRSALSKVSVDTTLADALHEQFRAAHHAGHGDEDLSAVHFSYQRATELCEAHGV